ncbi:osmotically inducible protein C [Flammeovirga sp. MY04]|uniref:bifunctional alpha/beta hydrolase/OsmC family protein n=1 Tax=Flammeovirga sp. MY04 TaxID=1191459 RepID=UPI0008061623|nr:OsmC family protein [Flammeovirga sp. MY04]ANQ47816.1 osmotically inducible protein C [Flammeovirga sp. MY04]
MSATIINFKNRSEGSLHAQLFLPADEKPLAFALFVHCYALSGQNFASQAVIRGLNQKGFGILALDFTGETAQDAKYIASSNDIIDATEYLIKNYAAPKLLIGHSIAASACLIAAKEIHNLEGIVSISGIVDKEQLSGRFKKLKYYSKFELGDHKLKLDKQLQDQLLSDKYQEDIKQLKKPILIFHSPFDDLIHINNAETIYQQSFHPKSFITLDKANHFLTNDDNADYVGKMIGSWAERYIEMQRENPLETQYQTAVRIGTTKYITEIKAGKHHQIADEPIEDGGKDLGPNPYQFLLAGLGACTAMTLRMYANHKKWPLDEVDVHLNHEREYLKDANETNKRTAKLDKLYRHIQVKGDLTEEQRQRLLEIANKCPVHRTLENNPIIITELLEE